EVLVTVNAPLRSGGSAPLARFSPGAVVIACTAPSGVVTVALAASDTTGKTLSTASKAQAMVCVDRYDCCASCSNSNCSGDPTLASSARALVYNCAAKAASRDRK